MPLKLIYPKAYLFIVLFHPPDTLSSKKPHPADKKPLPSIPLRIFFWNSPWYTTLQLSVLLVNKQDVALTGCNDTGPPWSVTDDDRQHH